MEPGCAPGQVWTGAEYLTPRFDRRTVHPVTSRYNVWAVGSMYVPGTEMERSSSVSEDVTVEPFKACWLPE